MDEDGDGSISSSERKDESIFDLRFVNSRDNAVIWLKVHPLAPANADRDLEVILENYADGLAGAGLFEQSSLFGVANDKVRQFTTFIVTKEPAKVRALPAIHGVLEIADVEKLRLDPKHRDSKAELVFAKVSYLEGLGHSPPNSSHSHVVNVGSDEYGKLYAERRTGLLVIGYYNDAVRFDSHVDDFHALWKRVRIPAEAIPPGAVATTISSPAPDAPATPAPSAEPSASAAPSAPGPTESAAPPDSAATPAH